MGKLNIDDLNRTELLELQTEVKEKLKTFRPYRIKERVIQCGKPQCWCSSGRDGHGPYLYVTYRENDRTKSVSIGPKLAVWEMEEAVPGLPSEFDYLLTPDHKYMDMPRADGVNWVYAVLTPGQFFGRYGVTKSEDTFGRSDKFWGTGEDWDRYRQDFDQALELREIPQNQWVEWGVSTLRGVAVLEQLEQRGYYLKA
jgi:hypothetical protein